MQKQVLNFIQKFGERRQKTIKKKNNSSLQKDAMEKTTQNMMPIPPRPFYPGMLAFIFPPPSSFFSKIYYKESTNKSDGENGASKKNK